MIPTKRHRL